jgi:hypothetical protein
VFNSKFSGKEFDCTKTTKKVDNQLLVTTFPCVLSPLKTKKDFFYLQVEKSNVYDQIDYFKHFSIFLDEMLLPETHTRKKKKKLFL